jgi:site-specific DNA-methyltransferase (adenine-specific)
MEKSVKRNPGEVRDAIITVLSKQSEPMMVSDIAESVNHLIGETPSSSIRSYLRLNTPSIFDRESRGYYYLTRQQSTSTFASTAAQDTPSKKRIYESNKYGNSALYLADCLEWLSGREQDSIEAVVTDPPYALFEYSDEQQRKLREGKGGVWRIPPSFDGCVRSPLPRFTTINGKQVELLKDFFYEWAELLLPVLVPGANVVVASNPLLSHYVSGALSSAGLERRGEIIRLVMTMRGGDRPKGAEGEFSGVSVMPRSMWEPWLLFRKPIEGRVQDNLREWGTGGFRRPDANHPFGDVIKSSPAHKKEREIASHPSLKPQAFLRQVVRAVLPLGKGTVLDPFAGSGSTLAAAEAVGYRSIGIEKDNRYYEIAKDAIPRLAGLEVNRDNTTAQLVAF